MTSASLSSTRLHFIILTVLGVVLLQGILIANGAFGAMLKAIWFRQFADGKPLNPVFTGLPVVDELLAMSVSFWDTVAYRMPALRYESIMLCASLQTLAVWATIERMRVGSKHVILRYAPIYIFCWQYFGTAIFVPFYCHIELDRHFNPQHATDPRIPLQQAKALIPAAVLAVLHPYRMVYFPPHHLTDSQHQAHIAFYQLGPFACYALIAAFANFLSSDHREPTDTETTKANKNADLPYIKATYATFGLFSLVIHVMIFLRALFNPSSSPLTLSTLFVPRFTRLWSPTAAVDLYVEESLFFLQWDFILVVLACSVYVARIYEGMSSGSARAHDDNNNGFWSAGVVFVAGVAQVLLGPGAVVSAVLYVREGWLREQFVEKEERERVTEKGALVG